MLGQGIGRALPDLQRLQGPLRTGRLLLISPWHPETIWQPRLESLRGALLVILAERLVVAQLHPDDSTWEAAQRALQYHRPVLVRASDDAEHQALLAQGALPIAWPSDSTETLVAQALAPARRARPSREPASDPAPADGDGAPTRRRASARGSGPVPAQLGDVPAAALPDAPPVLAEHSLADALMRALRRRHGVTGKGTLLQLLAVPEADLDRALATLIATGLVVERRHRTGAGYAVAKGDAPGGAFQLSLFGQEEE
jgi:hypothetical protein